MQLKILVLDIGCVFTRHERDREREGKNESNMIEKQRGETGLQAGWLLCKGEWGWVQKDMGEG